MRQAVVVSTGLAILLILSMANMFLYASRRVPDDLDLFEEQRVVKEEELGAQNDKPLNTSGGGPNDIKKGSAKLKARARLRVGLADSTPKPATPRLRKGCGDNHRNCTGWGADGQCSSTPEYMFQQCKATCGLCAYHQVINVTPQIRLNSGAMMPAVGFGTAAMGEDTEQSVTWALEAGYRSIDSAQAREWYQEDQVGAAIAASGVPREQLFITSKLHPRDHGFESAAAKIEESLGDLQTSYLDLFLLHYAGCWDGLQGCAEPYGAWQDSWRALEAAVKQGKLRAIGVSNFELGELAELRRLATVKPAVVQRNSDPFSQDAATQAWCRAAGVQYEAYSSLGTQWNYKGGRKNPLFDSPAIAAIAQAHNRSAVQVTLRWALQHGQVVIPASSNKAHIEENLHVYDFELTPGEMVTVDDLDGSLRPEDTQE